MQNNCAIIGYGDFTRNCTIPSLNTTKRFKIKYILVRSAERAVELNALNKDSDTLFVNSYERILNDDEVKSVFIVTRHDKHKEQILQAVRAGKAVFTEKPMAMNLVDAEEIAAEVKDTGVKLMVGFNRRFSPFALEIKSILQNIQGPFLINYRWINQAWEARWPFDLVEGGGKLVSSGCHMLDLVMFLLGDVPVSVDSELKTMIKEDIDTHDTASVRLQFQDGSTANICTSELGAVNYPQEKIEIFTRQGVIVLDNFKHLSFYGINKGDICLDQQNKGFVEEMYQFADYLEKDNVSPCSVDAGVNIAKCTEACQLSAEKGCRISIN